MSLEEARARVLARARGPVRQAGLGEVRRYRVLDRRDRAATAPPTPVTVTVPAGCLTCGAARGEPEDMKIIDSWTGGEYVISSWRNPCGHVDLHEAVLVEAERFGLQSPATAESPAA